MLTLLLRHVQGLLEDSKKVVASEHEFERPEKRECSFRCQAQGAGTSVVPRHPFACADSCRQVSPAGFLAFERPNKQAAANLTRLLMMAAVLF